MAIRLTASLAYGVREGRVLHAEAVEAGLACGCACPACGFPLRARHGPARAHFVHANAPTCSGAVPASLRLLGVQAFTDLRRLRLPPLERIAFAGNAAVSARRDTEREQGFDRVDPGGDVSGRPVDAVGTVRGRRLAVLFRAALPAADGTASTARDAGTALLEVDVRDAALQEPDDVPAWIAFSAPRRWLWHPWADAVAVEATLRVLADPAALDASGPRARLDPGPGGAAP